MATILLIEEDPIHRTSMMKMLTKEGHQVVSTSSGGNGIRLYSQYRPDIVVLDMLISDQTGFHVIKRLGLSGMDTTAIIAVAEQGRWTSPEIMFDVVHLLGVRRTLLKPYSESRVLPAIHAILTGTDKNNAHTMEPAHAV